MNKISNCPSCGKIYVDTGLRMCRDCYEKEQEAETVVSSYVRENPNSTIREICEATGVKEKIVMRMLRAGRFIESGINISYPCESCGAPIKRGKLCDKCSGHIMRQVQEHGQKQAGGSLPPRRSSESRRPIGSSQRNTGMHTSQDEDGISLTRRRS